MSAPRLAGPDDIPQLARSLTAAFADDPVFAHVLPEGPGRLDRMERFFQLIAPVYQSYGHTYVSDGVEGGALWAPPGHWRIPMGRQLRLALPLLRIYGARSLQHLGDYHRLEKVHARQPPDHWYLAVLGTDPVHQGKGIGASVLEPVLELADQQGAGAYLESSKEANLAYYRRFGFEVLFEHEFHAGGPSVWPMWRDPRPPGSR
jgi:ribosomal protein S18 acetylase RimI-like enzyme